MEFFTSPEDLKGWINTQESPDNAAKGIIDIVGLNNETDIVETCKAIFKNKDFSAADVASKSLFSVLAKYGLTMIKVASNGKLTKTAQVMRQGAQYSNMPLRICPKLPYSVGKKLISTYNCRHYCLDSITLDDDPGRVYCMEALWRQSVMDKFSREWKDGDGKLVGGYINERFQVYKEDGGNQMSLANHERTRLPRPHQYSTERRLEEARGEKTLDIIASAIRSNSIIKLASTDKTEAIKESKVLEIFSDIVEMKTAGLSDEDIITKASDHYNEPIEKIASIHRAALKKMSAYASKVYSFTKTANYGYDEQHQVQNISHQPTMMTTDNIIVGDGNNSINLEQGTIVVLDESNGTIHVVDGELSGRDFMINDDDLMKLQPIDNHEESIQNEANLNGLNDTEDFPITTI
jgi:hypothetical protein